MLKNGEGQLVPCSEEALAKAMRDFVRNNKHADRKTFDPLLMCRAQLNNSRRKYCNVKAVKEVPPCKQRVHQKYNCVLERNRIDLTNKKLVLFGTGQMSKILKIIPAYYVDNNKSKWGKALKTNDQPPTGIKGRSEG